MFYYLNVKKAENSFYNELDHFGVPTVALVCQNYVSQWLTLVDNRKPFGSPAVSSFSPINKP